VRLAPTPALDETLPLRMATSKVDWSSFATTRKKPKKGVPSNLLMARP
jgi:hypothetical protein